MRQKNDIRIQNSLASDRTRAPQQQYTELCTITLLKSRIAEIRANRFVRFAVGPQSFAMHADWLNAVVSWVCWMTRSFPLDPVRQLFSVSNSFSLQSPGHRCFNPSFMVCHVVYQYARYKAHMIPIDIIGTSLISNCTALFDYESHRRSI